MKLQNQFHYNAALNENLIMANFHKTTQKLCIVIKFPANLII